MEQHPSKLIGASPNVGHAEGAGSDNLLMM